MTVVPKTLSTHALVEMANDSEGSSTTTHGDVIPQLPAEEQNNKEEASKKTSEAPIGTLLTQLAMPYGVVEHYALPATRIPIIVRDNDLGSIIAYALTTQEYENKRQEVSSVGGHL